MGLDTHVKGLSYDDTYHCGYSTFNEYRIKVAYAFNPRIGELYERTVKNGQLNAQEEAEWLGICNSDLDIFLWHSDCDGKLTPQECRKIYNAMKNLKVDMQGHNYGTCPMRLYNTHQKWLNMFKHCYEKRVNLYFG